MSDHIEQWFRLSQSPNPATRWRALRGLLQFEDARLSPLLLAAFTDLFAPEAEALDLGDVDLPTLRYEVVQAMVKVADPAFVEPMISYLTVPDIDARYAALEILGAIRDTRATFPLIDLLKAPVSGIRWRAAQVLMETLDPRSVDAVKDYYQAHPEERSNVRWRLEHLLDHFGVQYERWPG